MLFNLKTYKKKYNSCWLVNTYLKTISKLKSPSPIYFVKNWLPDFLRKEFLLKMYRRLQNYIFEAKPSISARSLFRSESKVIRFFSYPCPLVCYCCLYRDFICNLYESQYVLKVYHQTMEVDWEKQLCYLIIDRVVLFYDDCL